MRDPKLQQLVDELQAQLVGDSSASLVPIVGRAVRIAHLADEPEYAALFELHLDGVSKDKTAGARVTQWPDPTRQPRWDPVQAFFQDRAASTGQVQGMPLEQLEALRQEVRMELRKAGDLDPGAGNLAMIDQEHTAILSRIRNRVAVFANAVEKSSSVSLGPPPPGSARISVFVGHGRSRVWLELKEFLEQRLTLPVIEFNRESAAGVATSERLAQMLSQSHFAFLVFTAEDPREDGSMHARENVIHEAGLFQGRLSFRKAIILLEDGCQEFSNIHGLGQIRFRRDDISSAFEEIRKVLEREGIVSTQLNAL